MTRREALGSLAAAAGAFMVPRPAEATAAFRTMLQRSSSPLPFAPKVYTDHEWATVRLLVDYLIPKDATSGSATDAMVPEFMDTMLDLEPGMRVPHRGGLAWLDDESHRRFGAVFVDLSDANRRGMLDLIAFPKRAPAELGAGVAWFNSFRDFTATGFFTSEMGVKDLGYQGNTAVAEWTGCPPVNYTRLGVTG